MSIFLTSLEQALIFLPLVLGMYTSYRILNITDLTVDGTYVLGAAVFAQTLNLGLPWAMLFSIIAGAAVGSLVSYMQKGNIVNALVVGVLGSFMLYSVNLQVLGRPNISLLGKDNILTVLALDNWLVPLAVIGSLCFIMLYFLLRSHLGLVLRAFGHDQKLLAVLGKAVEKYRLFGLMFSNALAALTGVLAAQVNGFADINMGFGVALVGIGAVVIGRQIIISGRTKFHVLAEVFSCFVGILLYFSCLSILLKLGIDPINLKLVLGIVLFAALRKMYKARA